MRYIIFLFFVGCADKLNSKVEDVRCIKMKAEASRLIKERGHCEMVEIKKLKLPDGTPVRVCKLMVEAQNKCDNLPYDPKYKRQVSGSSFYRNKQISKDLKEKVSKDK